MINPLHIARLRDMKQANQKIACLTAYDASFARVLEQAGVDVVLVGDSLGMVLQGETDTLKVTMEDMIYHTRLVSKGLQHTLLLADMPVNSYVDSEQAFSNARRLINDGGAGMVKLEGGREILEQINTLHRNGVAICGHLGLQPQSVHKYGGYKVQGRNREDAERILADAVALEQAGVNMIVLECIPRKLAAKLSASLSIPVIGIGAGPDCDGQVLVLYDVIGISGYIPKMANDFLQQGGNISNAVRQYVQAVRNGKFPTAAQSFD